MKSITFGRIWMSVALALATCGPALFAQIAPTTFQASTTGVGCNPIKVVTGDFDGDHIPDVAFLCVANSASDPLIEVLLGNGDGTFRTPVPVTGAAIGTGLGNKLLVADFNHDGKSDMAYVDAAGNLVVLLSTGGGSFHPVVSPQPNAKLSLAAVADLNKDGLPDVILFSGLNDSLVTYAYGQGNGTFGKPVVIPWPASALVVGGGGLSPDPKAFVAVSGDFNGDGTPDLLVGVIYSNSLSSNSSPLKEPFLYTLLGQSDGFGTPFLGTRMGDSQILVGDFDGDGTLDLLFSGPESDIDTVTLYFYSSYFKHTGVGGGGAETTVASDIAPQAGDLNLEGKLRIVTTARVINGFAAPTATILVWVSQGNTTLQPAGSLAVTSPPSDLILVDLNGDGKLDIVTANPSNATIALNTTGTSGHGAAPPIVTAVSNTAGGQPGIAPGAFVSIYGSNFAAAGFVDDWGKSIVGGKLPTILDGVTVAIGGQPAYVVAVTPSQINVLVPSLSTGPMQLTVTTSGGTSAPFSVTSQAVLPAFFTWPNSQAVATHLDYSYAVKNGTFNITTVAAKPGEAIVLWGTGFGATNPAAPNGQVVPGGGYNVSGISVTVGGMPATVLGAALAPGLAGLYQVAIQLPMGLADGDYPVVAAVSGTQSPASINLTVRQ